MTPLSKTVAYAIVGRDGDIVNLMVTKPAAYLAAANSDKLRTQSAPHEVKPMMFVPDPEDEL